MQARFRVIEATVMDDGSSRFRVVDIVKGGSASKHGVFKVRTDPNDVCSALNAEGPKSADKNFSSVSDEGYCRR